MIVAHIALRFGVDELIGAAGIKRPPVRGERSSKCWPNIPDVWDVNI